MSLETWEALPRFRIYRNSNQPLIPDVFQQLWVCRETGDTKWRDFEVYDEALEQMKTKLQKV